MRWIILGLAASALLAGCGKSESSDSVKVVQKGERKPGLWEQTVVSAGRSQTQRTCLGEGVSSSFSAAVAQGAACTPATLAGTAHGFSLDTTCEGGTNGRTVAHAVISGDPASAYRMEVTTTVTGAAAPQVNGTRTSVTTAAWKGPCPAGMKPGDIDLPDGTRVHP